MKRPIRTRLVTCKLWLPMLLGGIAFQFGGCDATTKDTVLTGLQTSLVGLVTTLINAFFQSIATGASGSSGSSTSQPTVQAVFDHLRVWLA